MQAWLSRSVWLLRSFDVHLARAFVVGVLCAAALGCGDAVATGHKIDAASVDHTAGVTPHDAGSHDATMHDARVDAGRDAGIDVGHDTGVDVSPACRPDGNGQLDDCCELGSHCQGYPYVCCAQGAGGVFMCVKCYTK